jgi:hypothetical protein
MGKSGVVGALIRLLQEKNSLEPPPALSNALAALNNCSLRPEVAEALATPQVASRLLEIVVAERGALASMVLRRCAAAVLAKSVSCNREMAARILGEDGAVGAIARLFKNTVDRSANAHYASGATAAAGGGGWPPAADGAVAQTRSEKARELGADEIGGEIGDDEIGGERGGVGLIGATLRILTCCAKDVVGAAAEICEAGALPRLGDLVRGSEGIGAGGNRGNAALCIAECAREPRCLAVLAALPIVVPLLDIAHTRSGQEQRNAAIALGRLAKNQHCLQVIRDNHGIEILARATAKHNT